MSPKTIWSLIKETYSEWSEDKASRLGAALAYYTVFSLAPLLIIVIAVASLAFSREAAQGLIVDQLRGMIGLEAADAIETAINNSRDTGSSVLASVIGVVTLLLGASGLFGQLQDSLNTIWEVQPKPGRGILGMLRARFISFTMVLGVAFLLLVSLVLSAGLAGVGTFLSDRLPLPEIVLVVVNFALSFAAITLLFAMIFKFLPDVKVGWSDVWIGATMTALLFVVGKEVIGRYLGNSAATSAYGAAGALTVVLLWTYYSAQILFLGAEFTQVYAKRRGSWIIPTKNAIPLTEEARAQQGIPRPEQVEQAASGKPVPSPAHAATRGTVTGSAPARAAVPTRPGFAAVRALVGLIGVLGFVTGLLVGTRRS